MKGCAVRSKAGDPRPRSGRRSRLRLGLSFCIRREMNRLQAPGCGWECSGDREGVEIPASGAVKGLAETRRSIMCQLLGMNCNTPTDICFVRRLPGPRRPYRRPPGRLGHRLLRGRGVRVSRPGRPAAPRRWPSWCATTRSIPQRHRPYPQGHPRRRHPENTHPSSASCGDATGCLPTNGTERLSAPNCAAISRRWARPIPNWPSAI